VSSVIHDISCSPARAASGATFHVTVTYTYDSDERGHLTLAAELPDGPGEQITIEPASRQCEKGDRRSASFSLDISLPSTWKSGPHVVNVAATLTEGDYLPKTHRHLAACRVEMA